MTQTSGKLEQPCNNESGLQLASDDLVSSGLTIEASSLSWIARLQMYVIYMPQMPFAALPATTRTIHNHDTSKQLDKSCIDGVWQAYIR